MVKTISKITKGDVVRTILQVVKVTGVLSVALVAPKVLGSLAKLGFLNFENKRVISNARNRLIKDGYLIRDKNGFLHLTEKGTLRLHSLELANYTIVTPKTWDKKWRVLIFDIPNRKNGLRDKVRNTLNSIGFVRLQDSVWAFPYDCSEFITLLKVDFKIGKDLLHMVVDQIENDKYLKEYFHLQYP